MKVKRILCIILCLAMVMSIPFAASAIADPELGTSDNIFPPEVDIIEVNSKAGLKAMRNDPTGYYRLTADIVFTAADFSSDGDFAGGFEPIPSFSGVLNGNGHTIIGLQIAGHSEGRTGLFAENKGTICDLRLVDVVVTQDDLANQSISYVGVLSGNNVGKIVGCAVYGTMTAKADNSRIHIGGLTGRNSGTVENCASSVKITVNRNADEKVYVGGVAGSNEYFETLAKKYKAKILTCYDNSELNVQDAATYTMSVYKADIAGLNSDAVIEDCYYPEGGKAAGSESYDPELSAEVDGYVRDCAAVAESGLSDAANFPALDMEEYWRMGAEPVLKAFACYNAVDHVAKAETTVTKAPTCYQTGLGKIECKLCSTAIRTDVVIPATGNHNWDTAWTQGESGHYHKCLTTGCTAKNGEQAHTTGELIVDTAPGCITNGVGHKECTECGKIVQSDVAIPSTGEHAYTVEVAGTKTPATCTSTGSVTMKCKDCTETQQKTLEKDPANHTGGTTLKNAVAATCGKAGYSGDTYCNSCSVKIGSGKSVPATGKHSWDKGVVTKEPTTTKTGVKTYTCSVCKTTKTETLPKKQAPVSKVNFVDVKKSDFFYTPVQWAVANGVTSGTSATTFSPNEGCTRAQAVTFLWRAAGQPAPKSSKNPFNDVKKSDYFYKAVLWAAENGVTSGTTPTTFAPNETCTRGQIVTFMWRALSGKKVSASNPFTDVKKSDFYYNAVLWAVKIGATTGTSATTFGPNEKCTRGQIVTFLYRAIAK